MRLPKARIVNGYLLSEPSLDPPEDPPEVYDVDEDPDGILEPAERYPVDDGYDDYDDWSPEYQKDCDYWERCQ